MKIAQTLLVLGLILPGLRVFADGYCPAPYEYKSKMQEYQVKAMKMMANPNTSEDPEALLKELEDYQASLFPNCMNYFNTTSSPDCQKLGVLYTSYMMLDKSKQPSAKSQILDMMQHLPKSCETEVYVTRTMMK